MRTLSIFFFVFFCFLTSRLAAQQEISQAENAGLWKDFYLYAGDEIKFEFTGEKKNFQVYFYGPSVLASTDFDGRFTKVKDVTVHALKITKEGPHTIGLQKPGMLSTVSGVIKVIRIPAPGKEDASLTFARKYKYKYEIDKKGPPGKTCYIRSIADLDAYGYGSEFYLPPDRLIAFSPTAADEKRAVVLYNGEHNNYKVLNEIVNQGHQSVQKGDTLYFELRPKEKPASEVYIWIARPDQFGRMNPDLHEPYNPQSTAVNSEGYLAVYMPASGDTVKGALIAEHDGLIGFYFRNLVGFDTKVLRFVGKGNDPAYKVNFELAPVFRSLDGNYQIEPILNK